VEYLGLLVWQNRLDPISILSNDDLETIIRREVKTLPPYQYGRSEIETRKKLLKVNELQILKRAWLENIWQQKVTMSIFAFFRLLMKKFHFNQDGP